MRTREIVRGYWRFVILAGLGFVLAMAGPSTVYVQGPGGPAGVDIKIRAQNRSTTDTPFCGIGGGMVGDRLDVDAFMDTNGVVTGTARFQNALGDVTVIDINRLFGFGPGLVAQNHASQDTVAIWISDFLPPNSPALVNIELPRGCGNTQSTFTPGADKLTMEIKFR